MNLINFYNQNKIECWLGMASIIAVIVTAVYCFYILHEMIYEGAL